ncbi:RNA polymerase I enhancer binding protein [Loxospora ochrophaea]|nr:RNA polymerase I enhancer binding protein [Loxospora ochrophaea]
MNGSQINGANAPTADLAGADTAIVQQPESAPKEKGARKKTKRSDVEEPSRREDGNGSNLRKEKPKRKKRKNTDRESHDLEEGESAQPSHDTVVPGNLQDGPSSEDDYLAASQLQAEASPIARQTRLSPYPHNASFNKDKRRKKDLKSKGPSHEDSEHVGSHSAEFTSVNQAGKGDPKHSLTASAGLTAPHQLAVDLDQVESGDEAVTAYLSEYQNEPLTPTSQSPDEHDSEGISHETKVTGSGGEVINAEPSVTNKKQRLGKPPSKQARSKSKKKMTREGSRNTDQPSFFIPETTDSNALLMKIENYKQSQPEDNVQGQMGRMKLRSNFHSRGRLDPPVGNTSQSRDPSVPEDGRDQMLPSVELLKNQESQNIGSTTRPPKKRKRRVSPDIEESEQFSDEFPTPKRSQSDRIRKDGAYSTAETNRLHRYRDSYCKQHNITHSQFNVKAHANAHNNPDLQTFWKDICDLLPERNHKSIQRFCRRQFHNFEKRGTWTNEEDAMLLQAIDLKGTSWKAVGEICDRHHEDCRDRYRNHLYNSELRNRDEWTENEVNQLCRAVEECMQIMLQEKKRMKEKKSFGRVPSPSASESDETSSSRLINWKVVSDHMGGSRGRLQCRNKWVALQEQSRRQYLAIVKKNTKVFRQLESGGSKSSQRRWERAKQNAQKMKHGDQYDLLMALRSCDASVEESIIWGKVGSGEHFRQVFSKDDCKAAWEMMKDTTGLGEEKSYKEVVEVLISDLMEEDLSRLEEHWEPEQGGGKRKKNAKKQMAHERVVSSEEEGEGKDGREPAELGENQGIDTPSSNDFSSQPKVNAGLSLARRILLLRDA